MNPIIEFIFVPPFGTTQDLIGRVRNVNPNDFKVAVYIFVEGAGWWTKPTFSQPLTTIQSDSTWTTDITTVGIDIYATRIHAYLLPNGINPPLAGGLPCLPDTLNTIAVADVDTMRNPRSLYFSGYEWWVKMSGFLPVGPGPNFFSDSLENVWVDGNDNLHLRITERSGTWYCPEVILYNSLGYGQYVFQVTGQVGQINENVILGLFTWDNDGCSQNFREIDIEFSRWGNAQDTTNAQYVVQPWNVAGNLQRWYIPTLMDSSTHSFDWYSDSINFLSVNGHQSVQPYDSIISSWKYTGPNIPTPGSETTRMNLWLFNGQPPSDGQEVEVIISRFEYIPHQPVSIKVENASPLNQYFLSQNYPNPFNPNTTISFYIPQRNFVSLRIYNVRGQLVKTLVNNEMAIGTHQVQWNGRDENGNNVASGIYIYHLKVDDFHETHKMALIR